MNSAQIIPFPIREQETLITCKCGCPDFVITDNMKLFCSDRNCGKELKLDEVKK